MIITKTTFGSGKEEDLKEYHNISKLILKFREYLKISKGANDNQFWLDLFLFEFQELCKTTNNSENPRSN